MNPIARIVLVTGILFVSVASTTAQIGRYHFEAGVNTGTLLYQGDLIRSVFGSFKGTKPMLQLWVAKPFSPYLSWRASLLLKGDSERSHQRNVIREIAKCYFASNSSTLAASFDTMMSTPFALG